MTALIIGLLLPFIGTTLGSATVFLMRGAIPPRNQKIMLGFASGIMIAASVWSLLIPSMEMTGKEGFQSVIPALTGFLGGMAFLLLLDKITPHLHLNTEKSEGPRVKMSRSAKLVMAVTLHNIPEGMAVGVTIAGALEQNSLITAAAAVALSIGIAIQNFPEGAIISMPLRNAGNSRAKSFWLGTLSGIVEPLAAALTILLASVLVPVIPYLLAFSAGAMIYVVIEELIPEASQGEHSDMATIGFAIGFALMMVLDVVL
ncbi:MAG: ZIP family metal transporter [Muribaculaceae bacterium]|nr:ZIP family metal transporter [Muribaculaceae bacterium]